ncbi:MAG: hypothetical protein WC588_05585 [Candidatus Micrarchaeia archaeon]
MAHARSGAPIIELLRSPNQGFNLAVLMRRDRQLIYEVGRVLASDEFFRAFSCAGERAKKEAYANLVDLRAAARIFFASDAAYEKEICLVIRMKYTPEYSSIKKSAGNKK